jgi:hypothetical protein
MTLGLQDEGAQQSKFCNLHPMLRVGIAHGRDGVLFAASQSADHNMQFTKIASLSAPEVGVQTWLSGRAEAASGSSPLPVRFR